jgi:signal transduction histidine kinase
MLAAGRLKFMTAEAQRLTLTPEQIAPFANVRYADGAAPYAPLNLSAPAYRRELLGLLTRWFLRRAAHKPLLLIMEDLHWTDPTTLELLGQLVGKCASASLFLLFTTRNDYQGSLRSHDGVTVIALGPLTEDDSKALIATVSEKMALPVAITSKIANKTDGNPLYIEEFVTVGVSEEERAAIGHPPVGKGVLSALIKDSHVLRLRDISQDPRSVGFPPNHPPMRSLLGAPVISRGRTFGNIYLTEKIDGADFDDEDERAVKILATQAAVAVENAQLIQENLMAREERERLLVLEDRERIARELHDGVIQSLFAVGMGLQAVSEMSNDPEVTGRLDDSVNEVDRVIRDLRNYIFGLRPGILADRQLDRALRELAESFETRTGIVVAVTLDESLAAELASRAGDIVQIVREALSNVGRHSQAETCRVSLSRGDAEAVLDIDDDGRGFEVAIADSEEGSGMRNIRERAESLGGRAEILSGSDGTTIRVSIPA